MILHARSIEFPPDTQCPSLIKNLSDFYLMCKTVRKKTENLIYIKHIRLNI